MTDMPLQSNSFRPVSENVERFLREILDRIPISRIAGMHVFPSIRQGVHESGVAVAAVWPDAKDGSSILSDSNVRPVVFTAHYRLTIKGADRGRWEFDCIEEADAPLMTVETVVRGVQKRSGDTDDPVFHDSVSLKHVLNIVDESLVEHEAEVPDDSPVID